MEPLTPAQHERLYMLTEEFGEASQYVGKTGRHGYESYSPFDPNKTTNRELLRKELLDVLGTIRLMEECGDIERFSEEEIQEAKIKRKTRFTHHQEY